jgi:hypothetical protein
MKMEVSDIIMDISLHVLEIVLLISILLLCIILYKNIMKFLRLWDRFYGNHRLFGTPDFE